MDTATFNSVALGTKLIEPRPGDITWPVIVDEVLGKSGVVTRTRGGGTQRITVKVIKDDFANAYERSQYPNTLATAIGNVSATLSVDVGGGVQDWASCICERIAEVEGYAHNLIVLEITFVRSI